MNQMCGGVNAAQVTTGHMSPNNGPKGGRPYTNTMDTLCGYYKYTSMGSSVGALYISLSKNGNPVGGTSKQFTATANYVYFQVPFSSGQTPDTLRIDIQSSNWPVSSSYIGSVLYVDNLYLKSLPLGIFENKQNLNLYTFPNPASNILNIRAENLNATGIVIYDLTGKPVKTLDVAGSSDLLQVDVSAFSKGLYYYEVKTSNGNLVRR
jgi:hypothetical protein